MIYLDGDIQVLAALITFSKIQMLLLCCHGLFCEKNWSNSPQFKIGYCQQCLERVHWPAEMGSPPLLYFNAGLFVYQSNILTYSDSWTLSKSLLQLCLRGKTF
ncbi:hypothetical protein EZV62_001651 [Acer yangbiense]|uniref:Hexosyltransferase n=1 Tax=Acer yangbiense TaxID=1000413 RepID=A0A5C7IX17_9ROSI|nr:hypothetical protein EZV62_001651 [Acer yangbiense]